jgi:hypothetical protein
MDMMTKWSMETMNVASTLPSPLIPTEYMKERNFMVFLALVSVSLA